MRILLRIWKLEGVNPDSLERCHRLGSKKDAARPILVRFSSIQLRARAWKAKTMLKGSKITLTEFLTKARQDLFVAARNHIELKKCWSADGVIIALLPNKKRAKIASSHELKKLISQHTKQATVQGQSV